MEKKIAMSVAALTIFGKRRETLFFPIQSWRISAKSRANKGKISERESIIYAFLRWRFGEEARKNPAIFQAGGSTLLDQDGTLWRDVRWSPQFV